MNYDYVVEKQERDGTWSLLGTHASERTALAHKEEAQHLLDRPIRVRLSNAHC